MGIPMPSHVCSSSFSLSRIKLVFLCFPKSSINMLSIRSGIVNDPVWSESSGLSDHSPVSLCFGICGKSLPGSSGSSLRGVNILPTLPGWKLSASW